MRSTEIAHATTSGKDATDNLNSDAREQGELVLRESFSMLRLSVVKHLNA